MTDGEREAVLEDLRALLRAVGMFDGARPESAHELMARATDRAEKFRGIVERVAAGEGARVRTRYDLVKDAQSVLGGSP